MWTPSEALKAFALIVLVYVAALFFMLSAIGCGATIPQPGELPDGATADLPVDAALHLHTSSKRCSAIAIGPDQALTAKHCESVEGSLLETSQQDWIRVKVAQDHPSTDLTLLTTTEPLPTPYVSITDPPSPGAQAYFMGYGCNSYLEVRPALYLGVDPFDGKLSFAGMICPGDSGGAVLDETGALIGVAVSREASGKPLFWAIAAYRAQGI